MNESRPDLPTAVLQPGVAVRQSLQDSGWQTLIRGDSYPEAAGIKAERVQRMRRYFGNRQSGVFKHILQGSHELL